MAPIGHEAGGEVSSTMPSEVAKKASKHMGDEVVMPWGDSASSQCRALAERSTFSIV
jgi:D-arabinose 1-dehydrogenase-like Zn-dependent alcohol dehydrogenase